MNTKAVSYRPLGVSQFSNSPANAVGTGTQAGLRWLAAAHRRYRQRRALLRLDDRLLNDIGVTREQALDEACKPFWRP